MNKLINRLSPTAWIALSFISLILLGAVLLYMPFSQTRVAPVAWIDALFISTSAVCVTGLAPVDIGSVFNLAGQIIILFLIQIGGLGVMTLSSIFFMVFGKQISMKQTNIIHESFAGDYKYNARNLIKTIVFFVSSVEMIGVLCLFPVFYKSFSTGKAAFLSVFHSISAFCNAGLSPFGDNMMQFQNNIWVNFIIMFLIVSGGIGFVVVWDIYSAWKNRGKRFILSLHTKLVLITTGILIFGGGGVILLLELHNPRISSTFMGKVLPALFHSVTARTCGFNTVDLNYFSSGTLMIIALLMFIGASPGSCGGGVKTTTFSVLFLTFLNRFRGQPRISTLRKTIPDEQVIRAIAIVIFASAVLFILALLCISLDYKIVAYSDYPGKIFTYLFECISAFGTVGLSMGITAQLNAPAKCIIMLLMFIGRIGFLSIIYQSIRYRRKAFIEYAEEGVLIG